MFIFVSHPDRAEEACSHLGEWLGSLDGHPGYLGGSVLTEVAGAPLPLTFTRGQGRLARMLHIHATEIDQFSAAG
ncbi:MAG TPA: hypothetical protein VLJ88_14520 [Propionibacteriaceae bacterium]|nr:hypothetical protein [Propionibacteriaceae bacterium]